MSSDALPIGAAPARAADVPQGMAVARAWTLRYLLVSTLLLLVTGLMGAALRGSLADFGRMSDAYYYAVMTVHGLGAFLGWAGFAVMGVSIWILARLGFEPRRFGVLMFATTFWTFVVGVVLIVISTLFMKFGGSWVALYPLPFHSAGVWGRAAAFIFTLGVLLVGVGIITWCIGIWHTVIGPGLHSERQGFLARTGAALGFGYLWKKRFPMAKPLPFAVIPLTVIAIDMIIATVPLAVLLVEMLVQVIEPSISVDPLLAKNILWWFGHPVVYLLLFPAVAVYYFLVPKYAKRPLVAGGVIAVAWTIAVIANVMVWAHHVYLDYPDHTHQGFINTIMQPMTFALTIPSALSVYSLTFTILRSRFHWNAASWALFLGLLSWVLAGLQGVVNATIAADVVVHNTMWIVGHFHHMALLNIGLVIFAAIYHFVPEMTGKRLYSDSLGKWHIWLTFWGQMLSSAYWMIDGLRGSPRRFAIPQSKYDLFNQLALVGVALLVIGGILFVINMVYTLQGKGGRVGDPENVADLVAPSRPGSRGINTGLALGTVVATLLASLSIVVVRGGDEPATASPGTGTSTVPADPGADVFTSAGCGGCHTMNAAGAAGAVGPNLDQVKPTEARVNEVVTNGLNAMPAFSGQLSAKQIDDLSKYVAENAGK